MPKNTVKLSMFEDDGAHWVKLTESRETAPGDLPYLDQSLSFCGDTPADAIQRARTFVALAGDLLVAPKKAA